MKKTASAEGFRNFWRDRNAVLRVFFFLTFFVLFIATLFYGYFRYTNQLEEEISQQINAILEEVAPQEQIGFDTAKDGDLTDDDKKNLSEAASELHSIYLENSSRNNGVRALLHRSFLLWRLGDDQSAEDSLNKIRENHQKSLFAPTATYALALIFEENGSYEKADAILEEFVTKYPANFLLGEVLLARGRILLRLKRFQQAYEIYQKIIESEDLSSYSSQADIELSYLESMGHVVGVSDALLGQNPENSTNNAESDGEKETKE